MIVKGTIEDDNQEIKYCCKSIWARYSLNAKFPDYGKIFSALPYGIICIIEKHMNSDRKVDHESYIPIKYCPFCGSKIEYEEIRDDKYIN